MTNFQLNVEYNRYAWCNMQNYERPRIVGFFSIDKNRQFDPSNGSLKYLRRQGLEYRQLNLNTGYGRCLWRNETPENEEKISFILQWLIHTSRLPSLAALVRTKYEFY